MSVGDFLLLLGVLDLAFGLCVLDNKKGWWVECGVKDSYLLRIKDFGGVKAKFDFGLEFGNEKGFPYSVQNSQKHNYPSHPDTYQSTYQDSYYPASQDSYYPASQDSYYPAHQESYSPTYQDAYYQDAYYAKRRSDNSSRKLLHKNNRQIVKVDSRAQTFPYRYEHTSGFVTPTPMSSYSVYDNIVKPSIGKPSPIKYAQERTVSRQYIPKSTPSPTIFQSLLSWFMPTTTTEAPRRTEEAPTRVVYVVPPPSGPPPPLERMQNRGVTIGPELALLLKKPSDTPASTAYVPSFAAKTFVVKEASEDYYPFDYKRKMGSSLIRRKVAVEIPRTKFFCEEQKYLPGIYADIQLGCKVFHLCTPASLGSSMTSFLCPNATLFDQSILQCNWWFNVKCNTSHKHFDANLALALSYRKYNAAHLPLLAANDLESLALLSPEDMGSNLPKEISRMGKAMKEEQKNKLKMKDKSGSD